MSNNMTHDNNFHSLLAKFAKTFSAAPARTVLRSYEANLLSQIDLQPPVLDLACGDGVVSAYAFGRSLHSGCDLMMSQLQKAKQRDQYKTLTFADAREMPYRDSSFGMVMSNSVLEHVPNVSALISETARVLKPGGLFVFTVPNPRFNDWYWANWLLSGLGLSTLGKASIEKFNQSKDHFNIFDKEDWKKNLLEAGFGDVKSKEYFAFPTTLIFSMLEYVWAKTIKVPWYSDKEWKSKKLYPAFGLLDLLPQNLKIAIQVKSLALLARMGNQGKGSHYIVFAEK